ncbi:centromere protein R isoform 3-T3 [Molossus nigricans]
MARIVSKGDLCGTARDWMRFWMDSPFLLPPQALGSVVAETVFPAGHVECDPGSSACSPALFRLLFPSGGSVFSEEVARLVLSGGRGPSLNVEMPVKRSLKLDYLSEANIDWEGTEREKHRCERGISTSCLTYEPDQGRGRTATKLYLKINTKKCPQVRIKNKYNKKTQQAQYPLGPSMLLHKSLDPSKITKKKSITNYSPTTGTCRLSPFASPTSSKEHEHINGPSNGKRKKLNHLSLTKRKESTKDDELMVLLSKVDKSSEEIMEIIQSLSITQALEDSRKLENLIGISYGPCFLKREMKKTKELMTKIIKQKLFEKKSSEVSNKGIWKKCTYYEHQLLHLPDHI